MKKGCPVVKIKFDLKKKSEQIAPKEKYTKKKFILTVTNA